MGKYHTLYDFMMDIHQIACRIPLMARGEGRVYITRTQSGSEHFFSVVEEGRDNGFRLMTVSEILTEYGAGSLVIYQPEPKSAQSAEDEPIEQSESMDFETAQETINEIVTWLTARLIMWSRGVDGPRDWKEVKRFIEALQVLDDGMN